MTRISRLSPRDVLHLRLAEVAKDIIGVDLDDQALLKLSSFPNSGLLLKMDVENLEFETHVDTFDVVVAGEIIEHLSNPGKMLTRIKEVLRPEGQLVITTPNAFAIKPFVHAIFRRRDVNSDLHTLLFTFKTLSTLLERHGFSPVVVGSSVWQIATRREQLFRPLFKTVSRLMPFLADTIICVARIENYALPDP